MIRTDGIPTIAFANLRHITEPEIEEDYVEEYIDYLLTENGVHIEPDSEFVMVPTIGGYYDDLLYCENHSWITEEDGVEYCAICTLTKDTWNSSEEINREDPWEKYLAMDRGDDEGNPESNIWDEPWAEYDWLLDPQKPVDLMWDSEPDNE